MSEILFENLILNIARVLKTQKVRNKLSAFSQLKQTLIEKKLEEKAKRYRTFIFILVLQACQNKLSQLQLKTNENNLVLAP